jgi:hypothetical protein
MNFVFHQSINGHQMSAMFLSGVDALNINKNAGFCFLPG